MPAKTKICERCHEEKPLTDFIPRKLEHAWCVDCRREDPRGAKLLQDRLQKRLMTPEQNRVKHQTYKEQHPEYKDYTDLHLQRRAGQLAVEAIEQAKAQAKSLKQQGYTKGQIEKVVGFLSEWGRMFKPE